MDVEVHDKQSYYLFSIWHLIATLASLLSSAATCSELSYMRRRVSEPSETCAWSLVNINEERAVPG